MTYPIFFFFFKLVFSSAWEKKYKMYEIYLTSWISGYIIHNTTNALNTDEKGNVTE